MATIMVLLSKGQEIILTMSLQMVRWSFTLLFTAVTHWIKTLLGNFRLLMLSAARSILIVALIAMVALDAPAVDTVSPRNQSPYPPVDPVEKLSQQRRVPFSTLDPVKDLGLKQISHGEATSPPKMIHKIENRTGPLPTCAWYQNLIMNRGEPGSLQRVYTNPLVLDVSGPIPGLRVHPNHVGSSVTVMQLSYEDQNGITVGISRASSTKTQSGEDKLSNAYSILSTTPLGITLQWVSIWMLPDLVNTAELTLIL
jgi:hypothetical protein